MSREIKFKAWSGELGKMSKPFTLHSGVLNFTNDKGIGRVKALTDETILQYTGLKDKNGVEIYEGDILRYYVIGRHVQQSHADISPEIDEPILKSTKAPVVFKEGIFTTQKQADQAHGLMWSVRDLGLPDIETVREILFGNHEVQLTEEMKCDYDGTEINSSVVGIEVIGNIHQRPELLKQ